VSFDLRDPRERASINYRLLRIAAERYGKAPAVLEANEQSVIRAVAAREYLIEQAVLASPEARAIVVPASQLDSAVAQIAARYADAAAFTGELAANGLGVEDLRHALARELRVESVLALVGSRAPQVEDTEVNLFYYLNREKFNRPETRTARHILVTINPQFSENTRDAAAQRVEQIRRRVSKHPARFPEQATKHSECPTSLQGGLLGDVQRGALYPELDAVLFALGEGQVSAVTESPIGLHVLLCERIRPAGPVALKDVAAKLREQIQDKQRSRTVRRWIRQALEQAGPEPPGAARESA